MDSDYPLQDELIGVIRLPLAGLDLGFSSGRQHTCLILHEKTTLSGDGCRRGSSIHPADAAKLNLKISRQAEEIGELQSKLKKESAKLEATREEYSALQSRKIELEMEKFEREVVRRSLSQSGDGHDGLSDEETEAGPTAAAVTPRHLSVSATYRATTRSAPVSKGTSPVMAEKRAAVAATATATAREMEKGAPGKIGKGRSEEDRKCFELLGHLRHALAEKDEEIAAMRQYIKEMKVKTVRM